MGSQHDIDLEPPQNVSYHCLSIRIVIARILLYIIPLALATWTSIARYHLQRIELTSSYIIYNWCSDIPILSGILTLITYIAIREAYSDLGRYNTFGIMLVLIALGHCLFPLWMQTP